MEQTLVIIKPDAVARRLVGEITARFEKKGLSIKGLKLTKLSEALVRKHYEPHKGKHFYEPLVQFMIKAPVVLMVIEGIDAITVVRKMMGKTSCREAEPGTIRGDFGMSNRFNLIHGSDSPESAEKEIGLFFSKNELIETTAPDMNWVYDICGDSIV